MASTNKTPKGLSQFIGSDKPTFLGDYNADMLKIDQLLSTSGTGFKQIYQSPLTDNVNIDTFIGDDFVGKYRFNINYNSPGNIGSVGGNVPAGSYLTGGEGFCCFDLEVFTVPDIQHNPQNPSSRITVQIATVSGYDYSQENSTEFNIPKAQRLMRIYSEAEANPQYGAVPVSQGWNQWNFEGVRTYNQSPKGLASLVTASSGWGFNGDVVTHKILNIVEFGHLNTMKKYKYIFSLYNIA